MVKRRYANEAEIPAELKALYSRGQDGTFSLSLEDDEPAPEKKKVAEMRDHNIELRKQLEAQNGEIAALKQQFEALSSKAKDDEEQALLRAGKFDEVAERRTRLALQRATQEAQDKYAKKEQEIQKAQEELAKKRANIASAVLRDQVQAGLGRLKLRIRPSASPDLIARAASVFKASEDLNALMPQADDIEIDGKPFSVDTWLGKLVNDAPHLFEGGEGGGVKGGSAGGGKAKFSRSELRGDAVAFGKAAQEVISGKGEWVE